VSEDLRHFLVLGDPVDHSLSPVMHNGAIEALALPAEYDRRRVDAAGMQQCCDEMRQGLLDGANITMPHKRLAADLADHLAPDAARARSVNTWVRDGRRIEGHSTDVVGVRRVLADHGLPSEGPVVVLGTGGAAAATVIALSDRPLTVLARRPEVGRAMVDECGVDAEVVAWDVAPPRGLVVNCTPIGMRSEVMPARILNAATGYLEMVYARGATPAERQLGERSVPVAGGLRLLAAQAEASFEMWFGIDPPPGLMYRLADKCLKERSKRVES
jgi:shikimate dehydrogenase